MAGAAGRWPPTNEGGEKFARASGGAKRGRRRKETVGMSHVFLVDAERRPLTPVHPGRARLLLKAGKAAVFKRFPFTLILRQPVEQAAREPLRLKIDPGSHTTGLALVGERSGEVLWAGELTHQGAAIVDRLPNRPALPRRHSPP